MLVSIPAFRDGAKLGCRCGRSTRIGADPDRRAPSPDDDALEPCPREPEG